MHRGSCAQTAGGGDRQRMTWQAFCFFLLEKETCNTISHEMRVLLHCRLERGTILMLVLAELDLPATHIHIAMLAVCVLTEEKKLSLQPRH